MNRKHPDRPEFNVPSEGTAFKFAKTVIAIALSTSALWTVCPVNAAIWTPVNSQDWNDGGNWTGGVVPGTGATAVIDVSGLQGPVLSNSNNGVLDLLSVGELGSGSLKIDVNGQLLAANAQVAATSGFNSRIDLNSPAAVLSVADALAVGLAGTGVLSIQGGIVGSNSLAVGVIQGADGSVTLSGANSRLSVLQSVVLGVSGAGHLQVESGAQATVGVVTVGANPTGVGDVSVTGPSLLTANSLRIGDKGPGSFTVSNGGAVVAKASSSFIGRNSFQNQLMVDGKGSLLDLANLSVGSQGNGTLVVSSAGVAKLNALIVGQFAGSSGSVIVTGAGSTLNAITGLTVGRSGIGSMSILDSANVSTDIVTLAEDAGTVGTLTVDGHGSMLQASGMEVGASGAGVLNLSNGAVLSINKQVLSYGILNSHEPGSSGTINIGAVPGGQPVAPGVIDTKLIRFGDGNGTLNFNHSASSYSFDPEISGLGTVNHLAGVTAMTHDSSGFMNRPGFHGGRLV